MVHLAVLVPSKETNPSCLASFAIGINLATYATRIPFGSRFLLLPAAVEKGAMPPFEGFEPINLRQASSLYDNIVDEVNTYSNGLTGKFHISFQHHAREDVVATRDIIVGKHPLYEPGTPEWDEYVLGKEQEQKQQEEPQEEQEVRSTGKNETSTNRKQSGKRSASERTEGSTGCQNPSDALEWLEMFTAMCLVPKPPRSCAGWTTDDLEPREEEVTPEEVMMRKRSVQSDDASLPRPVNRVLYPIAKYPSRLDSQRLVAQRRKFLENQINFKPLRFESRKPRKPKKF